MKGTERKLVSEKSGGHRLLKNMCRRVSETLAKLDSGTLMELACRKSKIRTLQGVFADLDSCGVPRGSNQEGAK